MKNVIGMFALVFVVLGMAACATVPTGPLKEGEVRVSSFNVPAAKAGKPYKVVFGGIQKKGEVTITSACFTWEWTGGSESHCFGLTEEDDRVTVGLTTMHGGNYNLRGHLRYLYKGNFKLSNEVSDRLNVY